MDAVGMDRLSLAAAQGEQGSEPHHADGDGYTARPFHSRFTGLDSSVRTPEDAVHQV